MTEHATEIGRALARSEADAILAEASRAYFDGCRSRIAPFIDTNFSVAGSAQTSSSSHSGASAMSSPRPASHW